MNRFGLMVRIASRRCTPAILLVPAVRPTVALRPTEAFNAAVCYLRSTSTPASGERKHWSLMTAWPTSHRGGSKRRFWPCQNLTMVAASVALWAVTRRMPGKGDC